MRARLLGLSLATALLAGCVGNGVSIPAQGKFVDIVAQHPLTPSPPQPETVVLRPLLVSGQGVLEENALAAYVRTVMDRLLARWPGPRPIVSVYVVPGSDFTAEALRDGAIMITTGTFETLARTSSLRNEDALAFVVAHELSHVLLGHPAERARTSEMLHYASGVVALGSTIVGHSKLANVARVGVKVATFNEAGIELADGGLFPSWSRAQEEQADTLGIDLMARAGYSVEAVPAVLQALEAAEVSPGARPDLIVMEKNGFRLQPGEVVKDMIARMARTHPLASERERKARAYIEREYGDQLVPIHGPSFEAAAGSPDVQALLFETHLVEDANRNVVQHRPQQAASALVRVRRTPVASSSITILEEFLLSRPGDPVMTARLDAALTQPHATWPMFLLRAKLAEQSRQPQLALQLYRDASERFELDDTYPLRIRLLHQMDRGAEATALQVRCITLGNSELRAECQAANK